MEYYSTIKKAIGPEWTTLLQDEFDKPYFAKLADFVTEEYKKYKIWPKPEDVFAAYRIKPADVKVVIIGQDPYPNKNAHGLAFSSNETKRPVSLRYIFQEIKDDLYADSVETVDSLFPPKLNNLTKWAEQGVMLLNPVLTVREGVSNSHAGKGWEEFTAATIARLVERERPLAIVAWGKYAQNALHRSVQNANPGNYSCVRGFEAGHPAAVAYGKNVFSGNKHFSKINQFLLSYNLTPIEWKLRWLS